VDERAHGYADVCPFDEISGYAERCVAEKYCRAEVHDEFDGVGSYAGEYGEGYDGDEGRYDGDTEEDFCDVVDGFVKDSNSFTITT